MEPHRATSSGGAGAVKRCGSDSSCFELMLTIKTCFKMAARVSRPHNFYAAPIDFGLNVDAALAAPLQFFFKA
jgi:hypothetical protein